MGARILVVDDSPTIRKVVARILERHAYEAVCVADGLEALSSIEREAPDLLLVDFIMPRMNGFQLCLSVRQDERFAQLPIVLMSAKGDKIRGKFVSQTGALDAITKPFDARGLLAVVESALAKARGGSRATTGHDLSSSPETADSTAAEARAVALRLAERLADLVTPSLAEQGASAPNRDALTRAFAAALSPEAAAALASDIAELDLGAFSGEILSGDFGSISIAEILQLLDVQKKTGTLLLQNKRRRVSLFMRAGELDFASYSGLAEEFLLGRYLCDAANLSRASLERYVDGSRHAGRLLGDYLVALGVVDGGALQTALQRQTSELLYEVVRWRTGRFRFVERTEAELGARGRLGIQTGSLILEGFRRVDEWRLIEDSFDFSDVLFRDDLNIDHFDPDKLTEEELRVLSAIDGDRTVADVLDRVSGGSFENCKILYRLLNSRLVKQRKSP